jgi:hypothetical protein
VLASLPPEEQAVAEQVLRGGIPAVRTAIHLERERAAAEGRPAPNAEALLALAEQLLPRLKAAEWRDRAEAAHASVADISLRDLRSVVAGADMARDDETRQLAASLRDALDERLRALSDGWLEEIAKHLDEGRVVRALRLAGRPPEPSIRLTPELTSRLTEAASAAMSPDTPPERWAALLEAVSASPFRRNVKPAGLPEDPGAELLRAAHQQSGRVPALAPMLGISIPPPPGPIRPPISRPSPPSDRRGGRSRPPSGARPEPAPPPADQPAADQPAADQPAADQPAADQPAADQPAADQPAADQPAADQPAADQPAADQPAADQPAADQPAATDGPAETAGALEGTEPTPSAAPGPLQPVGPPSLPVPDAADPLLEAAAGSVDLRTGSRGEPEARSADPMPEPSA